MQMWKLHLHLMSKQWAGSFLLKDGFLNPTSKQIGAFSCQRKLMMLLLSVPHFFFFKGRLRQTFKLLMATQWLNTNLNDTTIRMRQSDGGEKKTKDVPAWLYKSGGAGYQHVAMTEAACGHFSHVIPPQADKWQLRQDTLLPPAVCTCSHGQMSIKNISLFFQASTPSSVSSTSLDLCTYIYM